MTQIKHYSGENSHCIDFEYIDNKKSSKLFKVLELFLLNLKTKIINLYKKCF